MSGSGPGPTVAVDRPEPRGARCPHCDSPIAGDYKFCPTCAFRLRTGAVDPTPAAPLTAPRNGRLFLAGLAGALLVVAVVIVGYALSSPEWFHRPMERVEGPRSPLGRPYIVADIPRQLIPLDPNGYAYSVPLSSVPGLTDDDRVRYEDSLRSTGQVLTGEPSLDALIDYRLQILRIEVTRGMYEEFLRDIDEHRDRVPDLWLEWDRKGSPADIDILAHVPPAWIRASDPTLPEWSVDEAEKNLPVAQVSYVDAAGFSQWASQRLGIPLSLPFVMEWARAARPPPSALNTGNDEIVTSTWPWGTTNIRRTFACNSLSYWLPNPGQAQLVDWYYTEGNGGATVNGVLSMAGNVREWAVIHDVRVRERPLGQPPYLMWETTAETRRARTALAYGGSFRTGIDDCQVDSRTEYLKTERRDDLGFRLVAR